MRSGRERVRVQRYWLSRTGSIPRCRGAGNNPRPPGGWPLPNDDKADQILRYGRIRADCVAEASTAMRYSPHEVTRQPKSRRSPRAWRRALSGRAQVLDEDSITAPDVQPNLVKDVR